MEARTGARLWNTKPTNDKQKNIKRNYLESQPWLCSDGSYSATVF